MVATSALETLVRDSSQASLDMTDESVSRTLRLERLGIEAMELALRSGLSESLDAAARTIQRATGIVIVTGMGKSGHIARKVAATLASTGTPSHFVHPAEASHGDLGMIRETDVVLAMSWSGETPELADTVGYTRRFSVPLIAVTSRPASALGGAADVCIVLPDAKEACPNGLAPTTSTTMQLVAGDALAVLLLELRGFTANDFGRFHPGGKLGTRLLPVSKLMHTGDEVPLVGAGATLSEAIMEMTSKRFGITGVVDEGGALVGVVTDGDLRRAFKAGFVDRPVNELMGKTPQVALPESLAVTALAQMNAMHVTCIFVVSQERPVGLIHIHDLLRVGVV